MSATLKVLNLNVWDLPYSQDLSARIQALCRVLESNDLGPKRGYDIIGFQEAFMEEDRILMTDAARKGGLMYSHFYDAGIGFPAYPKPGHPSGLMILSRYPIIQVAYLRFSLNGKPHRLLHWDWQTGKGCGLARIATPFGLVDVYLSHFIASYTPSPEAEDEYLYDRVAQAYECAEFIQMSRRAPLALLLCDLNSMPDSLPYQIIATLSGLHDSYSIAHPKGEKHQLAHTCNINRYADGFPRRVDFVFYSTRPLPALPTNLSAAAIAMNHYVGDAMSLPADIGEDGREVMNPNSPGLTLRGLADTERKELTKESSIDAEVFPSASISSVAFSSSSSESGSLSPPLTLSMASSSSSWVSTAASHSHPRHAFRQSSLHCPNTLGLAWDISDCRFVMTRPLPQAFLSAPRGLMLEPPVLQVESSFVSSLTTLSGEVGSPDKLLSFVSPSSILGRLIGPKGEGNESPGDSDDAASPVANGHSPCCNIPNVEPRSSFMTRFTMIGATMLSAISMATYRKPKSKKKKPSGAKGGKETITVVAQAKASTEKSISGLHPVVVRHKPGSSSSKVGLREEKKSIELMGFGGLSFARQLGYDIFGELNRGPHGTDILYTNDDDDDEDDDEDENFTADGKDDKSNGIGNQIDSDGETNLSSANKRRGRSVSRSSKKCEIHGTTSKDVSDTHTKSAALSVTKKSDVIMNVSSSSNSKEDVEDDIAIKELAAYNEYESQQVDWDRPLFLSDHVGVAATFELKWEQRPKTSRSPPPSPREAVSLQSQVLRPLDLGLDAHQESVLRQALGLIDKGLLDARGRQKNHQRHLYYGTTVATASCMAGYSGLVSPWWLVVLLPLCTLYVVYNFFIRTLFGNEEQSSMTAVHHAMALRLQVGPTRIAAGFLPSPSVQTEVQKQGDGKLSSNHFRSPMDSGPFLPANNYTSSHQLRVRSSSSTSLPNEVGGAERVLGDDNLESPEFGSPINSNEFSLDSGGDESLIPLETEHLVKSASSSSEAAGLETVHRHHGLTSHNDHEMWKSSSTTLRNRKLSDYNPEVV